MPISMAMVISTSFWPSTTAQPASSATTVATRTTGCGSNSTGNGKTSSRDALGSKVELTVGATVSHRQLFPAKSYLSSVELPLTFGLGKADHASEVTITWPSRKVTQLKDLKGGRSYRIEEDGGLKP